MKVTVTAACKPELEPIKDKVLRSFSAKHSVHFSFLKTGVGIDSTDPTIASLLASQKTDLVFNIGSAGALDTKLSLRDVFIPNRFTRVLEGKLSSLNIDPFIEKVLKELPLKYKTGNLLTTSKSVTLVQRRDSLRKISDASAVDMEAYSIASLCYQYKIPFTSIKIITDLSDSASENMYAEQLTESMEILTEVSFEIIKFIIDSFKNSNRYG